MTQDIDGFGKAAKDLSRNPLGIIALFIVLIYGFAALLLGSTVGRLPPDQTSILIRFLVWFPVLVLLLFSWLVARHHAKLYAPGDYKSDEAFLQTMRQKINEANEILDQLRDFAATSASATLTDLMAGNFMDGMTLLQRLNLHDRIIESLRRVGVSDSQIRVAETAWVKGIGVTYHRLIRHELEQRTQKNQINLAGGTELLKASKDFQGLLNFDEWQAATPDEMEAFINSRGFMNERTREWISDYRHFLETGEIRRRAQFAKDA